MARHWAEEAARRFLEARGYRLLAENYARPGGELDLVMEDGETLVFVEVRQRRTNRYGSPGESLTPAKLERLWRTALLYLAEHAREDAPARFDAVLVEGGRENHRLEHLQNVLGP